MANDIMNLLRKHAEYINTNKLMDTFKNKNKDNSNKAFKNMKDIILDSDTISCLISSHLITDFISLYLCDSDKKQRENSKQCLIYIWYCLLLLLY